MNDLCSKELAILRRVNQAISYSPDVEAVAGAILDIVIDEAKAENASIMMPSHDGKNLEIRAAKGKTDETSRYSEKPLGLNIPIGQGIAGKVAENRHPVILSDILSDPLVDSSEMKVKVRSLMSLPIIYGNGELVGVLNISHSKKAFFTEDDLSLMNIILAPAALALRNARLMKEMDDINALLSEELFMTDHAVSEFRKQAISMFGYISIGVLTCDPSGNITMLNRKASELTGLKQADNIALLIGTDTLKNIRLNMQSFSMDTTYKSRVLNFEFSPLPTKPQWQVMASIRDVTMERYRERDFKRIEDQYKDLLDNAIDAMYVLKYGKFLLTNKKFQELLGYTSDELFRSHYRHFITRDSLTSIVKTLRDIGPNDYIPNLEIHAKRKDGTVLILEISVGKLKIDGEDCFVGMVRDITSRKELLALKTRFLHVASHEIRVPLTVLRGYVKMLSRGIEETLSNQHKEYITEIEKHCDKLINFTNMLLDFARINSGTLVLNKQLCDLNDLLKHIVSDMQIKADERGLSIVLEADMSISRISIDPIRIEQALTNLIDNALKHSPEYGKVRVNLTQAKGSQGLNMIFQKDIIEISVSDSGPGVKDEEAKELFNEFFVGASGETRRGIGLGLAITKEIIHAHGGAIEAKASDEGGIFVVTIPLNTATD